MASRTAACQPGKGWLSQLTVPPEMYAGCCSDQPAVWVQTPLTGLNVRW